MYFQLTAAVKNRFIDELRHFYALHPRYADIVDTIQGSFGFEGRPQYGIIVKSGSGNRVDLSADNFVGTVSSYVYQAMVDGKPGNTIEWVKEDARAIQANGGIFPSPPGIYFIEVVEEDGQNVFWVDTLLDINDEKPVLIGDSSAQLANPYMPGTLRLYEMPAQFRLQEGINYSADPETGAITLTTALPTGMSLLASYRTPGDSSRGPFPLKPMTANAAAIPGCVLAFGNRWEVGDRLAIVVQPRRSPAYLEYGGNWELQMDFDILSRDVYAQQDIADLTVMYLWGVLKSRLVDEGLDITDIQLGGDSEEIFDETADDYFFNASFSLTVRTHWAIQVPLGPELRSVQSLTAEQERALAALPVDDLRDQYGNIRSLGLIPMTDPVFAGKARNFEMIR